MIKSENTIRKALRGLIEKGHIAEYLNENGRIDTNNDGTLYIIFLPEEIDGLHTGGTNFDGGSKSEWGLKNEPLQNLNPYPKITANKQYTQWGVNFEGAKFDGGSKIEGAKFEPPPLQNLRGANFEPPLQMPENKQSKEGVQNLRGANFEPIKDIYKDNLKDTLSLNSPSQEEIISLFYNCIGQKKLTNTKKERARECIKELLEDGFSTEDVLFAIEWTLNNSKEKVYDFSILKHTISQAMADKEKTEEKQARLREQEQTTAQERAEEERLEKEREEIEAFKEKMDPKARAELHQRALEEIEKMEGVKKEFVTDGFIRAKENEILKAEMDARNHNQ